MNLIYSVFISVYFFVQIPTHHLVLQSSAKSRNFFHLIFSMTLSRLVINVSLILKSGGPAEFTCSKWTIEAPKKGGKYVQNGKSFSSAFIFGFEEVTICWETFFQDLFKSVFQKTYSSNNMIKVCHL